jgi:Holliday junction resolvase
MNNYKKGARAEYELANYLFEDGWWVVRQAASGGVGHEACDVIALKGERVLVFEVKTGELPISIDDQLQEAQSRIHFKDNGSGCYAVYRDSNMFYYTPASSGQISQYSKQPLIQLIRQ